MRVSLQWLKELLICNPEALEAQPLAERLSLAGFEVEAIEDLAARAAGVVVGHVEAREAHPGSDRLSVCQVRTDAAAAPLQIVCGAPNVRAGIHVPVALVGSHLPAVNLTIKPAQIRGVASSGMICSEQELGLAESSAGIVVLEDQLEVIPPVGTPVGPLLGLDDQVLELAITANRPDGLSMEGMAREVAALCGGKAAFPPVPASPPAQPLTVAVADRSLMEEGGIFSMTALEEVEVGPSPPWLQRRLERAGLRPINNVVDITNLVMLETGQPLHAFDRDALVGGSGGTADPSFLGLRQAHPGEPFVSLDGEERSLESEALVVTYGDRPIALAGVMGGADTAVKNSTRAIWLEAAVFPSQRVRRSARSVGLRTEASARFEKGLPLESTLHASDRAVALLQDLAGAKAVGRWVLQRESPPRPPVPLERDHLHNLLGPVIEDNEPVDLDDATVERTLEALGCRLEPQEGGWLVEVPPSRALDLTREVDLIEEVARLVGYDCFASHLPDPLLPGGLAPAQQVERRLRRTLCDAGLQETIAPSLVGMAPGRLPLANPLLSDCGHLRDNLHEELLQAARRNLQASQEGFWAFEIGRVFLRSGEDERADTEVELVVGVLCGERRSERWSSSGKPRPLTYWEARGVLQQALNGFGLPLEDRPPQNQAPRHGNGDEATLLHPGRKVNLVLEGKPFGWFGQLHPAHAAALDLPDSTYLFQLAMAPLRQAATRPGRWTPQFQPFPTVPASERDLALVVPNATSASALMTTIRKAGRPLLEQVELVDRYEGHPIADGHCSQAFRLRYRDPQRTLTDAEVEATHQKVRDALQRQFKAQLRS
ncbi:MAG: phenylalanine--tRNA ligase subunit beta [Cyanobacteriota bacterium]|nr:phenylalanine--tRNA ligase subunit beta [Cyanobacteriota bacterium]